MVGQPQPQRLGRRCADQREAGLSQALRIARRRLARGLRLGGRNHSEQGAVIFFRRPGQERLDGRNDRGPIVKRLELSDGDLADDPPRRRRAVGGQRGDGGLREFRVGGEWASCPVGVPSVGRRFQQPAEHLGGGLLVPSAFAEAIDGGGQAGIVLPLRAVVIVAFPIGQIAGMGRLSRFARLGMPSASVSEDGLAGGTGLAGGIPAGRPGGGGTGSRPQSFGSGQSSFQIRFGLPDLSTGIGGGFFATALLPQREKQKTNPAKTITPRPSITNRGWSRQSKVPPPSDLSVYHTLFKGQLETR